MAAYVYSLTHACKHAHRFILVSTEGYEHVAAYGEDHGGSHYNYHVLDEAAGATEMRLMKGCNRKDVVAW